MEQVQVLERPLKEKDYSIRSKEGKWLNSSVFRQEAIKFKRNGYYCADPIDSPDYNDYWDEQLRRCIEGYEVGGWKITGHHYSYLNFSEIKIVDSKDEHSRSAVKETKPPDFWDGDFDYYWCLEIAKNGVDSNDSVITSKEEREWLYSLTPEQIKEERVKIVNELMMKVKPHPDYLTGGRHMIIGKSRRKGYSYKNADICKNTYNTIPKSITVIGAFDKKYLYPEGTMGMVSEYLSYLNKNTAWGKAREFNNKVDSKTASFEEIIPETGISYEEGYKSTIMAVTFKDNPDSARGKDGLYVLLEEAGKFPNLRASYNATYPGLTAGKYITGQILVFGTGGDMEGGTVDFAYMFYNPFEFNAMPFLNIWDKGADNSYCGFFHPVYMNMEGYYDEQGNSDIEGAIAYEMGVRDELIKNSSDSSTLQSRVQEFPMSPSEAFLTVSVNDFPIIELQARLNKVKSNHLNIKMGQPCHLVREKVEKDGITTSKVRAIPDLDNEIEPIWDFQPKIKSLKGGVIIYKYPIPNAPRGLYKIGFDPYRQDQSGATHPSLAAIYVYKGNQKFSYDRETIVAQYIGRPYSPDDVNRIVEMLAELYNAEIMHENEVTHVKNYFEKKKKLHLLAAQPDAVISKNIKKSTVARVWGIHMNDKLKDAGEKYIKTWLLTERDFDENGDAIYNLDTICDPGLLEELILYSRKGNFDRVMAFMMIMFMIEEEEDGKEYGKEEDETTSLKSDFDDLFNTQFKRA